MRRLGGLQNNRRPAAAPGAAPARADVDDILDDYINWREACLALGEAYEGWKRAARHERAPAFEGYVAALDHEEQVAKAYQWSVEHYAADL
ncbi:MAG TPA: hypothetical protein VG223_07195 [Solirubrobacteraceae bacterium]|nr:hypothetical protein [Solirubrobacteraceae bacterium]